MRREKVSCWRTAEGSSRPRAVLGVMEKRSFNVRANWPCRDGLVEMGRHLPVATSSCLLLCWLESFSGAEYVVLTLGRGAIG